MEAREARAGASGEEGDIGCLAMDPQVMPSAATSWQPNLRLRTHSFWCKIGAAYVNELPRVVTDNCRTTNLNPQACYVVDTRQRRCTAATHVILAYSGIVLLVAAGLPSCLIVGCRQLLMGVKSVAAAAGCGMCGSRRPAPTLSPASSLNPLACALDAIREGLEHRGLPPQVVLVGHSRQELRQCVD